MTDIKLNTEVLMELSIKTNTDVIEPLEQASQQIKGLEQLIREHPYCDSYAPQVRSLLQGIVTDISSQVGRLTDADGHLKSVVRVFEMIDNQSVENWDALKKQFPEFCDNPDLALLLVLNISAEELASYFPYGYILNVPGMFTPPAILCFLDRQIENIQPGTPEAEALRETFFPDHISDRSLRFIASKEGFRSHPYNDPAGHCTVGYGHLIHLGPCDGCDLEKPYAEGLTEEEALELLRKDVEIAENVVKKNVKVPLNQNQFDALVSFVFNLGENYFKTSDLLEKLNNGDYASVPSELKLWVHAKVKGVKVELPGLITRRQQEANIFENGEYPEE